MANEGDAQNKPQLGVSGSSTTDSRRENEAFGASERLGAVDGGNEFRGGASVSAIEKNLMDIAEELGAWLGTAERKTTDFLAKQTTITDHLVRIRDTAARLLAHVEKGRERSR